MSDFAASLLIQVLHGLVLGMLLFLVSSGLTLVFGMMDVLNLAHGSLYMFGAYFAYSFLVLTNSFWLSMLLAPIAVGVIGIVLERSLIRRTYKQGHIHQLLLTFGLAKILDESVLLIWGGKPKPSMIPQALDGTVRILGNLFPVYRLFIIFLGLAILAGMTLLLLKTKVGLFIRAAVSDAEMVDALGIDVPKVFMAVFGLGAAMAAVAGVAAAPFLTTHPGMGLEIMIEAFIVVIVGGLGNFGGAVLGSLIIGQIQTLGILVLPRFALVFIYLIMAVVLIARPRGLLGEKET